MSHARLYRSHARSHARLNGHMLDICLITRVTCYITLHLCPGHVEDIVSAVFQYLAMLREEGPKEWIFEECKVRRV